MSDGPAGTTNFRVVAATAALALVACGRGGLHTSSAKDAGAGGGDLADRATGTGGALPTGTGGISAATWASGGSGGEVVFTAASGGRGGTRGSGTAGTEPAGQGGGAGSTSLPGADASQVRDAPLADAPVAAGDAAAARDAVANSEVSVARDAFASDAVRPADAAVADTAAPDSPAARDGLVPPGGDALAVEAASGDGAPLAAFCTGSDSKVALAGKTWVVGVTSKRTDPTLDCCTAYAARLHAQASLGEDLEVVLRFRTSVSAGSYEVAQSSQPLWAVLRGSAQPDAGAGEASVKGTVTLGGTPQDTDKAWQMGFCVSVDDPSSRWQGLEVYIPAVPVAPFSWANRLRLWRLADSSLTAADLAQADLGTLALASERLLDLMDLDFVQLESTRCALGGTCTWMGLNTSLFVSGPVVLSKVKGSATSIDLRGVPYVLEADGERIYLGAFFTSISSIGFPGPEVMVEEIANDGFPVYPARSPSPDPRNDPRIVKVLTEAGKMIP